MPDGLVTGAPEDVGAGERAGQGETGGQPGQTGQGEWGRGPPVAQRDAAPRFTLLGVYG